MKLVLHIEDMEGERETQRLLYMQCQKRFHDEVKFDGVESWDDGMRYIRDNRPDVVILDLVLPPNGARETLANMASAQKQFPDFPPVVVLTGSCEPEMRRTAMLAGADDYVQKQDLHGHAERLVERVYLSFLRHAPRA